eukprot:g1352.t1
MRMRNMRREESSRCLMRGHPHTGMRLALVVGIVVVFLMMITPVRGSETSSERRRRRRRKKGMMTLQPFTLSRMQSMMCLGRAEWNVETFALEVEFDASGQAAACREQQKASCGIAVFEDGTMRKKTLGRFIQRLFRGMVMVSRLPPGDVLHGHVTRNDSAISLVHVSSDAQLKVASILLHKELHDSELGWEDMKDLISFRINGLCSTSEFSASQEKSFGLTRSVYEFVKYEAEGMPHSISEFETFEPFLTFKAWADERMEEGARLDVRSLTTGRTAMLGVLERAELRAASVFLALGANCSTSDRYGRTAMHYVIDLAADPVESTDPEAVVDFVKHLLLQCPEILLKRDASPQGLIPLMSAVRWNARPRLDREGGPKLVRRIIMQMLQHHPRRQLAMTERVLQRTALLIAVGNGLRDIQIMEMLIQAGAGVTEEVVDANGQSALSLAIDYHWELLLEVSRALAAPTNDADSALELVLRSELFQGNGVRERCRSSFLASQIMLVGSSLPVAMRAEVQRTLIDEKLCGISTQLLKLLLAHGAGRSCWKASVPDGNTPLHMAPRDMKPVIYNDEQCDIEAAKTVRNAASLHFWEVHCRPFCAPVTRRMSADEAGNGIFRETCPDVTVIRQGSFDIAEFIERFVAAGQPALIEGALGESWQKAVQGWSLTGLHNIASSVRELPLGEIPYASEFGVEEVKMDMDEYIKRLRHRGNADKSYLYLPIFSTSNREIATDLAEALNSTMGSFREYLSPEHFRAGNIDFYLGANGTGSPMHYQGNTLNVLVHGRKRWALAAPKDAFYGTLPPRELFPKLEDIRREHGLDIAICEQPPGSVLFLPHGFGRAALNLDIAVGVAATIAPSRKLQGTDLLQKSHSPQYIDQESAHSIA